MRLAIHLLPLPPQGPANSLFPVSRLLEPEHKFLHITPDATTIGDLFGLLEEKCKTNYLHEFEHDKFAIKKLQDKDGNDLPVEYTLQDLFAGEAQPITLKVVQARPDRESSIPVTSSLRPYHLGLSQRPARRSSKSRQKAPNEESSFNAYAHVNADTPIRSSEASPQVVAQGALGARVIAPGVVERGSSQVSSSRPASGNGHKLRRGSGSGSRSPDVVARPSLDTLPTVSAQGAIPQFAKPALPRSKSRPSLPEGAESTVTRSSSRASLNRIPTTAKSKIYDEQHLHSTELLHQSQDGLENTRTIGGTGDEHEISIAGDNHEVAVESESPQVERRSSNGFLGHSSRRETSAGSAESAALAKRPSTILHNRNSSGSIVSPGARPMLPADVLESLKRRRRANGDDSDIDFPPRAKAAHRSTTNSSTIGAARDTASTIVNGSRTVASPRDDRNTPQTRSGTAAKGTSPRQSTHGNESAQQAVSPTSRRVSFVDDATTPSVQHIAKARAAAIQAIPKAVRLQELSTPKTSQTGALKAASSTKATILQKTPSVDNLTPTSKDSVTSSQMERNSDSQKRNRAAESRKQELREEYLRQKQRQSQEDGHAEREAATLEYFRAKATSSSTPKSTPRPSKAHSAAASSSQLTNAAQLTPPSRQSTGILRKASSASMVQRKPTAEEVETLVLESSAPQTRANDKSTSTSQRAVKEITVPSETPVQAKSTTTGEKRKRSSESRSTPATKKRAKLAPLSSQPRKAPSRTVSSASSQDRLLQMEISFPLMHRVTETPSASPMDLPPLRGTQDTEAGKAVAETLKFLETSDALDDDIDVDDDVDMQSAKPLSEGQAGRPIQLDGVNGLRQASTEPIGIDDPVSAAEELCTEETAEPTIVVSESSEDEADETHGAAERLGSIDSERAPARLLDRSSSSGSDGESEPEPVRANPIHRPSLETKQSSPSTSSSSSKTSVQAVSEASSASDSSDVVMDEAELLVKPQAAEPTSSAFPPASPQVTAKAAPDSKSFEKRKFSFSKSAGSSPEVVANRLSQSQNGASCKSSSLTGPANPPPADSPPSPIQTAPQISKRMIREDSDSSSSSDESSSGDESESEDDNTPTSGQPVDGKAKSMKNKLAKFVKDLERDPEGQKERFSRAQTFGHVRRG